MRAGAFDPVIITARKKGLGVLAFLLYGDARSCDFNVLSRQTRRLPRATVRLTRKQRDASGAGMAATSTTTAVAGRSHMIHCDHETGELESEQQQGAVE